MLTLAKDRFLNTPLPLSTSWLLGECMELKGRQELWARQIPEILNALRDQAMIQSVESSNRIEGVTVAPDRLRPLLLHHARPRDRSEEELVGYRKALQWIFARKAEVTMNAALLKRLHAMAQGGVSGDVGRFKSGDNDIIEFLPSGDAVVRFRPASAKSTPAWIDALHNSYAALNSDGQVPSLLLIATCVFDFLCVHPFRDGNGRVSRLLTSLLLLQHDFQLVRYVSLERLIEDSKDRYYAVLKECSDGWHEGRNPILPWWNYFLGIVREGYLAFQRRVGGSGGVNKGDLARHAIDALRSPFTLAEIKAQCPSVSEQTIKKVLSEMKREGKLRLTGRGRGARWEAK